MGGCAGCGKKRGMNSNTKFFRPRGTKVSNASSSTKGVTQATDPKQGDVVPESSKEPRTDITLTPPVTDLGNLNKNESA